MSVVLVHREYSSSTGTLVSVAQRLLGALSEKTIGAQVVVNLSPAFVADFTAQVALVAKLGAEQSGAIGSLGTLVKTQAELLAEFRHQASVLRRAARLAFPRNGTLLRGEFQVGAAVARDMPRIIERGRNLLAACERYAVDLASCGWSTSSTEAFSDTVASLAALNHQRELVADEKLGLTAERVVAT